MSEIFEKMSRSVYPVFVERILEGKSTIEFTGSGFFISVKGRPVFVTAGHVGLDPTNKGNEHLMLVERVVEGEYNQVRCSGAYFYKKDEDLSIFVPDDENLARFKSAINPLGVYRHQLSPLSDVFSFGYPFSGIESRQHPETKVEETGAHIRPLFVKGYITRVVERNDLPAAVDKSFVSNYQVSFPCYPGISGSPLIVQIGMDTLVAGILYANAQTKFYSGPIEVEKDLHGETIHETYAQYDFGLAGTADSLLEAIKMVLAPGASSEVLS